MSDKEKFEGFKQLKLKENEENLWTTRIRQKYGGRKGYSIQTKNG